MREASAGERTPLSTGQRFHDERFLMRSHVGAGSNVDMAAAAIGALHGQPSGWRLDESQSRGVEVVVRPTVYHHGFRVGATPDV
jgi:hypothetical protein